MTSTWFALFNLGPSEFFWIFLIFLILFGARALPKLFRSLGKSVREFKRASDGLSEEMEKAGEDQEQAAAKPAAKKQDAAEKQDAAKKQDAKKEAEAPADSEPPAHPDE